MLLLPGAVKILLAAEPVDMRNSIDGLVSLVRAGWREDVFAGNLFVFVSRRRDRAKILTWDNGGFVVYYKRLEQGRFRLPAVDSEIAARLDATQLAMLLDGIDVSRVRRPKKWLPPAPGDRQVPENLISTARWPVKPSTTANGANAATSSPPNAPRSSRTSPRSTTNSKR